MIGIFPKMESLLLLVRPYLHKKIHDDAFISFRVINNTDKKTDRQTNEGIQKQYYFVEKNMLKH